MKISTAVFASIVAICCTVSYVTGQIQFSDGSVQNTAFDSPVVASVDRFNFTDNDIYGWFTEFGSLPGYPISPVVPAGQELVILQINSFYFGNYYTAVYPSPNELTDPIDIAYTAYNMPILDFPDGTLVVDEGRQLIAGSQSIINGNDLYYPCQVLGYYRDKN